MESKLKPKLRDYCTKEFIKFIGFNSLGAMVNFGSRIAFNLFANYAVSVVLAYFMGMATAFFLDKAFVFKQAANKTSRQMVGFAIINVLSLGQTLLFSWLFRSVVFPGIGFAFYPDAVAHLIGIIIPVFTSFLGHKYFSFGVQE